MTNEAYMKARQIRDRIQELKDLNHIAGFPAKRFFLKKIVFGMRSYDGETVCVFDEGLTDLIQAYCAERIKELEKELEAL